MSLWPPFCTRTPAQARTRPPTPAPLKRASRRYETPLMSLGFVQALLQAVPATVIALSRIARQMDPPPANPKIWDEQASLAFLEICREEVLANSCNTGTLNRRGYLNVMTKFRARTGRAYTHKQYKNRWDMQK